MYDKDNDITGSHQKLHHRASSGALMNCILQGHPVRYVSNANANTTNTNMNKNNNKINTNTNTNTNANASCSAEVSQMYGTPTRLQLSSEVVSTETANGTLTCSFIPDKQFA